MKIESVASLVYFFFNQQEKRLVAEIKRTAKTGNEVFVLMFQFQHNNFGLRSYGGSYLFVISISFIGSNQNSGPPADQAKTANF
jgi:hypothetical protein